MRMGLREANQNFSKAIKAIKSGRAIVLTERGKPIATITPIRDANRADELQPLRDDGFFIGRQKSGVMSTRLSRSVETDSNREAEVGSGGDLNRNLGSQGGTFTSTRCPISMLCRFARLFAVIATIGSVSLALLQGQSLSFEVASIKLSPPVVPGQAVSKQNRLPFRPIRLSRIAISGSGNSSNSFQPGWIGRLSIGQSSMDDTISI